MNRRFKLCLPSMTRFWSGSHPDARRSRRNRRFIASPIDALSRFIACGAHAVAARPEFAAGLATDPLTRAAMAQFDQPVKASLQPFLTD
jgi:hypothetical protein